MVYGTVGVYEVKTYFCITKIFFAFHIVEIFIAGTKAVVGTTACALTDTKVVALHF